MRSGGSPGGVPGLLSSIIKLTLMKVQDNVKAIAMSTSVKVIVVLKELKKVVLSVIVK